MFAVTAYRDQILADCAAIEETIAASGLAREVEHCEGWSVGDVIRHLGGVHRWATEVARTRQPAIVSPDNVGDDELTSWLNAGAVELCDALSSGGPHDECWTFGFPPQQLWFWSRRQAVETAVHRLDVEVSQGGQASIPSWLAADGLEEIVTSLFPRQVTLQRSPGLSGQVKLTPTDVEMTFLIGTPGGATAEVRGAAQSILRSLWRRPHGHLESTGDASLLAEFNAAALTP